MQKKTSNINIVITGAKGQLGLKFKDSAINFPELSFIFMDVDELDISNYQQLEEFFANRNIDVLINCAAYTAVDKAEDEPELAKLVNEMAPGYLAKLCKKHNVRFIHISTDYVFDGNANSPYNEKTVTNPQSVYGISKLNGEIAVLNQNSEALIIRTSWLYSEHGNNFVKTIIRLAAERDYLKVVYDQVGTPTYAGDLANHILQIVKDTHLVNHQWIPGVYHYSNYGVCSWYDFSIEILELTQSDTQIYPVLSHEFPTKASRPAYSVLDKSKIADAYRLEIKHWRQSLIKCIDILNCKN